MDTAAIPIGVDLQMFFPEGGPGWVSVKVDVISGVKADYGIHGITPKDRTADVGNLVFDMDNSEFNSGGVRGYYSIGHASCRAGFAIGTAVRLLLSHPLFGEYVKWVGTIESAPAMPGIIEPKVTVNCVDWMEEAAVAHPTGLTVMTNTQADAVFMALLGSIPPEKQPPDVAVSTGSDIYPYALDNVQDETSTLAAEFEKLALSEFGYIYVKAGRLMFEGRSIRATGGSALFALDEDDLIMSMGVTHGREEIINRVQVAVHPRRVDSDNTTVLFRMGAPQRIERGTSITINCPYRDPNQQAQRVGGTDMRDLEPGVDYIFNTHEDGSGLDVTAQITATPASEFGGNAADVTFSNAGPKDGYILANAQGRGKGIYDFEPVGIDAKDEDSIARFGQNFFPYDMPYQSSPSIADDTGQFILAQGIDPSTRVTSVTFMGNWSEDVVQHMLQRDISDKISVNAPSIAVDHKLYYINGVTLDISLAGAVKVTWDLVPVDTTQFWTLGVDGLTELDETTVLGYGLFVTRWVMDTDVLGTSTFLN